MAVRTEPIDDVARHVLVGEELHRSAQLLVNRLVHRHDIRGIQHGSTNVFGLESRVLREQLLLCHSGPDLSQDVLDG